MKLSRLQTAHQRVQVTKNILSRNKLRCTDGTHSSANAKKEAGLIKISQT
jgi:hypothetical protein